MGAIKPASNKGKSGGGSKPLDIIELFKNPKNIILIVIMLLIVAGVLTLFFGGGSSSTVEAEASASETEEAVPTGTYTTRINEIIYVTPTPMPGEEEITYIPVEESVPEEA